MPNFMAEDIVFEYPGGKETSMLIGVGFRFLHPSQDMTYGARSHDRWKQVNRSDQIEEMLQSN